jgi:hypothetical protein
VAPPRFLAGYIELKARINAADFHGGARRLLKTESVLDTQGVSASEFSPTLQATEVGVGYWLHPRVLAKVSCEFMHAAGSSGGDDNVLGMQLVVRFNRLQWGWK